jgi:MFS family permease
VPRAPLWRNRDFVLLQTGQLLSTAGSQMTTIAYPLLVLELTGSAAKAGIVGFASIVTFPLFGIPAGLAADRWNRKRLMIGADAVRALAIATLVVTLLADETVFWQIPVVAFVEGAGSVLFAAARAGALRAVVPPPQLPAAVATQTARTSVVQLIGPPLGGALFQLRRVLPFVVDAISYSCSTISLLLMRTPFQEERERDTADVRAQVAEGFSFLWHQTYLRTCALLIGIGDFILPGVMLSVVVIGKRQGLTGGQIGLLTALFGACLLFGSFLSPLSRRFFSVRTILLTEFWCWTSPALFLIHPSVYVLVAGTLPQAIAIPASDSVYHGYRYAVTPDRLVGRVDSASRTISLLASPFGPLLAGLLLTHTSERATIGVFAACGLVLALWGTLTTALRNAPSLAELEHMER